MTKNADIKRIAKIAIPILKKNGVKKAGIFGSYARGEEKKNSDVDLLVEIKGNQSLLDVVRLERLLQERLGRKVDLVEYCAIHPYLKERILSEEVRIL